MYKRIVLSISLLGILLCSCKHPVVYKEVQVPNLFSLQVPAYMHATNDLFKGGRTSMQYESDSAKIYLLVFDTARKGITDNTLKTFYDSIVSNPAISDAQIIGPKFAMHGKDSSLSAEMTGLAYNIKTYYRIIVLANPERFYYILLWTVEDRKEALKEDFDKIMGSFTDINHVKE